MIHPGIKLIEEIRGRNWTQKQFSILVGKKNSEVNELIKGKRNITIQRDLILSEVLGTPEKYRINLQMDYDYEIAKRQRDFDKHSNLPEIVDDVDVSASDITSNGDPDMFSGIIPDRSDIVLDTVQDNSATIPSVDSGNISEASSAVSQSNPDTIEKIDDLDVQKMKELKKIFMNF